VPATPPDTLRPVVYARRRGARAAPLEDWTSTWVCVGFAEQLRRPGDLLPATITGHALHVRRCDDGGLQAALNARPFGGCMSIPLQCAGARKIRCPHAGCAFSEDPELVSPQTDEGARMLPQFVGFDPARLVPVRLERWGSLLFVNLSREPAVPLAAALAPLDAAMRPAALDDLQAAAVFTHALSLGAKAAGRALAEAFAARAGAGPLHIEAAAPPRSQAIAFTRLVPASASGHGAIACYVVAPHLMLACLPECVLAAVLRPVGPTACSMLGAVLRPPDAGQRDAVADAIVAWWRDGLDALDADP
jgi:hypothetical protein